MRTRQYAIAATVVTLTTAAVTATAASPASPPTGVNYFSWGVESPRANYGPAQSKFDVEWFRGSRQDCTPGVAHSGQCAMRLDVVGNDRGNQQKGADLIQQNPTYPFKMVGGQAVYYRWWMKIMPGFSWGNRTAKAKASRVIAGKQGYTGYLMSYGFLLGECDSSGCTLNNGGSNAADNRLVIRYDFRSRADGQWHEYIVKVKPNTSADCVAPTSCDGEFQAWVDGVSVGEYNGFKLHNREESSMREAWGGWMVTPFFQLNGTEADGGVIYLDDFSTDSVWNSMRPSREPSESIKQ
jgi:hypothetical protein